MLAGSDYTSTGLDGLVTPYRCDNFNDTYSFSHPIIFPTSYLRVLLYRVTIMMDLSKHKLLNVLLAYALVTHSARAWSFHQKTSTPKSSSSSSHTRGQLFLDALSITGGGLGLLLLNPQKSLAEGRREDAKEAIAKVL